MDNLSEEFLILIEKYGVERIEKELNNYKKSKNKNNIYEFHDDYVVGYTKNNESFLFDRDDYKLLSKYTWCKNKRGYIMTSVKNDKKYKYITMHRMIMNANENEIVDHINRNKTDNRKQNLRICTQQENTMNRSTPKNNSVGYKGIYFDDKINKYIVRIFYKGKYMEHKTCKTIEEAIKERNRMEKLYFGEFS